MAASEFCCDRFQDLVDYRNRELVGARALGPLDVCLVRRRGDAGYLPFLTQNAGERSYLHWVLGADTSSVAAICAYFQRLQTLDKGAYASAGRGRIVGATVCVYNAFTAMDLRVAINVEAKPAVVAYAVDTDLRRHDPVTEDMLDGAFVSSCFRSITMPPSIVPSLRCDTEGIPNNLVHLFLKAAGRLLNKGSLIRQAESSALISRHCTRSLMQTIIECHFERTQDPSGGIKFFSPCLAFKPILAVSVARLYRMRGDNHSAASVLCDALKVAQKSVPLLLEQVQTLLDLKKPELALPLAVAACEAGPQELNTWIIAARVHLALKDYVMTMLCLNSLPDDPEPMELSDADMNDLMCLPHDAPAEATATMRPPQGRAAHEWAYYDLDKESEEVMAPDPMGLELPDEDLQPVLSNRLHGHFVDAYKVLIQMLLELDFVELDGLVRDLFYTGSSRHESSARLASSDGAAITAGSKPSNGIVREPSTPASAERKQRRLERRAAKVDRKLKKYDRSASMNGEAKVSNQNGDYEKVNGNVGKELKENGVDEIAVEKDSTSNTLITIPVLTVSRVYAQPRGVRNDAVVREEESEFDQIEEDNFSEKPVSGKLSARKLKFLRRQQRQHQKESKVSPPPTSRSRWRTSNGENVPRQLCGGQLNGMLTLLKDDIRAMQELRVELQKYLDEYGEEWQGYLGSTRSQHQWLQFAKVALRMRMYEEAEAFYDLCLGYGTSRAAYADLVTLFAEVGMLKPATTSLCELAAIDDDNTENPDRKILPRAVLKAMKKIVGKFGMKPVVVQLLTIPSRPPFVDEALHQVGKIYGVAVEVASPPATNGNERQASSESKKNDA